MTVQDSTATSKTKQDDNKNNSDTQQQPIVSIGENTCHVLPCDINYTGMAPTHVYFQPVPIDNECSIYASTFRGRGLLANAAALQHNMTNNKENDDNDNNNAKACLLSVEQNQKIHIKASIDNVLEWYVDCFSVMVGR
jgi:hypothetical protein